MDECPKGSPVRLTHGLVAPGVNDLCYADGIHRLQKPKPIFIPDGEAQRHVWLTPLPAQPPQSCRDDRAQSSDSSLGSVAHGRPQSRWDDRVRHRDESLA